MVLDIVGDNSLVYYSLVYIIYSTNCYHTLYHPAPILFRFHAFNHILFCYYWHSSSLVVIHFLIYSLSLVTHFVLRHFVRCVVFNPLIFSFILPSTRLLIHYITYPSVSLVITHPLMFSFILSSTHFILFSYILSPTLLFLLSAFIFSSNPIIL